MKRAKALWNGLTPFTRAMLKRAGRTFCQAASAMIPAEMTITDVDWKTALGTAALAGVLSMLNSFAAGVPEAS